MLWQAELLSMESSVGLHLALSLELFSVLEASRAYWLYLEVLESRGPSSMVRLEINLSNLIRLSSIYEVDSGVFLLTLWSRRTTILREKKLALTCSWWAIKLME